MTKRYYVAYGSNLNMDQMMYRCPDAVAVGTTTIPGYELLFKGSLTGAYLTIEKNPDAVVPAAVWATSADDEKALDRYEGCPSFYYKKEMKLDVTDMATGAVQALPVYVYIMHEERRPGMPSADYIRTCSKGYRDFGFSEEYLDKAIETTRKRC